MARNKAAQSSDNVDYVVVGAGSAGSALAEALSRDGRSRVAVIEAGGSDRRFFVQMPLGYGKTFYDRSINWGYRTEPDPGLAGQAEYRPRGRIVGGSGSINAMVWIRGDHRDYDEWAAEGNAGWAFEDLLPLFKAIEDNQAGANEWRGTGGPVHVSDVSRQLHPLASRFIDAGLGAGFVANDDFNGPSQEGIGVYQINTRNGWRMSSAKAFLRPALKRGNVRLITNALTTRILFDGKRAVGVEYIENGVTKSIRAGREVILSAGAINSAQLLELSGIGEAGLLKRLGIDLVVDSPAVGNHLQDHLGINYVYRSRVPTLNQTLGTWWGKLLAGAQFLLTGSGPLSLSLNQGGGFVKSRPDLDRPNIQLYFQAISTFTAKKETRPLLGPDAFPGFAIGLSNCRPKSRGSIHIRSKSPLDHPRIDANAFGTPEDVVDMLEGVKILRRIAAQPAFADIIAEELAPGPNVVTDEDLIDDFRHRSGTVYHPCGTCRMGPAIESAVVDQRLRVHGVGNLRVADASIFPSVISGNTNAAAIMVGVKAGMMVMEDRG
mgnify:CR=1 FL=1|jgi:choline dehydrogenase